MDDFTARLEATPRIHAVACRESQLDDAQLAKRFRVDLQKLIAAYGYGAVEAALDASLMPPPHQSFCIDP